MIQVYGMKNCDSVKKALSKENLLIKRPVIECNNEILIGFHHEKYQKVFL